MESERWRRIEYLYHSALERSPGQRNTFLTEACNGDSELRQKVESLLSQSGSTNGLVGKPVWEVVADFAEAGGALAPGTRLGPYEILGLLGQGGMGRVYRGLDTRLGRDVAIKITAEQFSERFEREARAISALNHPHICTLYDVGANYLVMELVEGETLAQRIDRVGPLPLLEALDIGGQIAEALEAAHHKGIVHRDLKPANVKITPEGRVKVLDFGLAKAIGDERVETNGSQLTTATALGSVAGQVLGTPAYMSPEQACGTEVDERTDVWAFGCLLYEVLSGKSVFRAATLSDTVAAIVEREPDWDALPAGTPPPVRDLLRGCLEKDVQKRIPGLKDARIRIEEAARKRGVKRWQLAWLLASGILVAAGLTALLFRGREARPDEMLHPVPLTTYTGTQEGPSFSPDGDQVAFSWDGEKQDNFDIYVKRIGAGPPLRLTHDPAADSNPAWSPDGRSIAFLRASGPGRYTVVLIPPLGGPERVVKEVLRKNVLGQALAWSPDSKWLAVAGSLASQAGLWLLSAETGEYRKVNSEGAGIDDISPAFAPDGRSLAFARAVAANSCDLYLLSLDKDLRPSGEPRRLTQESQVIDGLAWTADGRELVFSSGQPGNESLWRMAISGGARPRRLTEQHEVYDLAISGRSHRLVFVQSRREMDIYRAELPGQGGEARGSTPLIASSRLDRFPRYSPDGKKIAFASLRSGNWQVWMSDSNGGNAAQMTSFERGEVRFTSWSADGRQIGFSSNAEGPYQAYAIDLAGGKPNKLEALGTDVFAWCWSRDGRWIFFSSIRGGTRQFWKMPAGGGAPQQLTRQGATQPFESKDGRLLYYVRPEGVWSVSVDGGEEREVFKFDADELIEADRRGIFFATKSAFQEAGDLMFYRLPNGPITKVAGLQTHYGLSVSPDGRSLLYTKFTATGSDLMLVENFR